MEANKMAIWNFKSSDIFPESSVSAYAQGYAHAQENVVKDSPCSGQSDALHVEEMKAKPTL